MLPFVTRPSPRTISPLLEILVYKPSDRPYIPLMSNATPAVGQFWIVKIGRESAIYKVIELGRFEAVLERGFDRTRVTLDRSVKFIEEA
jgi:hypothetical protein